MCKSKYIKEIFIIVFFIVFMGKVIWLVVVIILDMENWEML